jgi:hypothetical protein
LSQLDFFNAHSDRLEVGEEAKIAVA